MSNKLLNSLQLSGFLSFGPKSDTIALSDLNLLIGPNGVGKSNFIEAIELLQAAPTDFGGTIREGGLPSEWIWSGEPKTKRAKIESVLCSPETPTHLRYRIEFSESGSRLEIVDEVIEQAERTDPSKPDVFFYYRFQHGHPAINTVVQVEDPNSQRTYTERKLKRETIDPQQSILSQKKDIDLYPEITATAGRFDRIQVFREWSFGRSAALRAPQSANLPSDTLLPQLVNLGLVLNELEHSDAWDSFNQMLRTFLPRYKRLSTKINAGTVQVYLHEDGLKTPIPATRLSDGTLRFLALLAILLKPETASLICIEEPELGLHPDSMALLAQLMKDASEKTQLVVTTHSDALVSEFSETAESVLVCDYLENGTTLTRLESNKLQHWLDQYRLGEVWRIGKLGGNLQ